MFQRHAGFFRQRLDPLFVAGELRRDRGVFKLQVLERSRELLARGNETIKIFFERSEPLFNAANVLLGRNNCDYTGKVGIGEHATQYTKRNAPPRGRAGDYKPVSGAPRLASAMTQT